MKQKSKGPKLSIASKRTPSSKAPTSETASNSKWIPIKRPFPLPPYVKEALGRLDDAGYVAYVVGGCVRDFLLDPEAHKAKDYDIATGAHPDEIVRLFPGSVTVGKAFGVIKVPLSTFGDAAGTGAPKGAPHEDAMLEIATFREDLEYEDHRHPVAVRFAGAAEDARRRDFTINAFFFDPKTSRVLDGVDGLPDLRDGIIRAIGDPAERFHEDALRLLRAVRFTTRFGFTLDPATAEAIKARAKLISKVSPERIREELTLMLTGPRPHESLELLSRLGLLAQVLPEVDALRTMKTMPVSAILKARDSGGPGRSVSDFEFNVWAHTVKGLHYLELNSPRRTPALAWAAVLVNVGKPVAARRNEDLSFNGHENDGAQLAQAIGARLKMSRADIDAIASMIQDQLKFRDVFQMRESTLQRFIRQPHFDEMLALQQATALAGDGNLAYHEFCASRLEALRRNPPEANLRFVDGKDLIGLGFRPGPEFSEILRVIEDLTLEKQLLTKEQALEYVVKHYVK